MKYDDLQDPYYRPRRSNALECMVIAIAFAGLCAAVVTTVILRPEAQPTATSCAVDCSVCHSKKAALSDYFRKADSPSPEQMAVACMATKNPRLMAAIAKIETGGDPDKRRSGYKNRHDGAFQVNPKHWQPVPYSATAQALQAEAIITELTTDHGIKKGLSLYGGDSSDRYERKVLAELAKVP